MLKAPFPWFGGKRRVAQVVWRAFGNVPNYVEPFFGSGAVLLGRPHEPKIETVNDIDRMVGNFWRAVSAAPEEVARHADFPVSECDLHARHKWLVGHLHDGAEFRERMHTDPDFFDVKIAGWWVWGLCQWIGAGWCVEPKNHKHPRFDGIGKGVHSGEYLPQQRPALNHGGMGVHSEGEHLSKKLPKVILAGALSDEGPRAYSPGRRPKMTDAGMGVHLPSLGNDRGLNGVTAPPCTEWFLALQQRLRRVRVACGDWKRVLGPSVLGKGKNVGGRRPCAVFLDPPYDDDLRARYLYAEDESKISTAVREWALEHGDDPELRIALCGYEAEHVMPSSWSVFKWTAARGYAGEDNDNRERERIWFSPHCLPLEEQQTSLFAGGTP